jgi:subtilisin
MAPHRFVLPGCVVHGLSKFYMKTGRTMATRRGRQSKAPKENEESGHGGTENIGGKIIPPGTTGRYLILFQKGAGASGIKALREGGGFNVASTADFEGGVVTPEGVAGADAITFDKLDIAVVDSLPDQMRAASATAGENLILAVEPERIVYALNDEIPDATLPTVLPVYPSPSASVELASTLDYLHGYRDAVNHLVAQLLGEGPANLHEEAIAAAINELQATWGLQVTKAIASRFSGRGIRVAVLDTGMDLGHPDFAGRAVQSQSFIANQSVQDGHGHGTHCIGTSCGPLRPQRLPRYGIAYEAEIFAGKVLSNQGSGVDSGILAGINWAVTNGCAVVSMSLGAPVQAGQGFSQVFEQAAQRVLAAGTLIVAAAGNESHRPTLIAPVGHPANCPSIMAVAAVDQRLRVASFSCGGLNPDGGQVDIAAPGLTVISTWPRPALYNNISGTSMATPHIAGIAALLAEANPNARGRALQSLLLQGAKRLLQPARDVGAGLVQAP